MRKINQCELRHHAGYCSIHFLRNIPRRDLEKYVTKRELLSTVEWKSISIATKILMFSGWKRSTSKSLLLPVCGERRRELENTSRSGLCKAETGSRRRGCGEDEGLLRVVVENVQELRKPSKGSVGRGGRKEDGESGRTCGSLLRAIKGRTSYPLPSFRHHRHSTRSSWVYLGQHARVFTSVNPGLYHFPHESGSEKRSEFSRIGAGVLRLISFPKMQIYDVYR